MIEYKDILKIIDEKVYTNNKIQIRNVEDSLDYVIAEDIQTDVDMPNFNKSLRDGYAVVSDLIKINKPYEVCGVIPAGSSKVISNHTDENKVYMIMTGAVLPDWADAVIQFEDTTFVENDNLKNETKNAFTETNQNANNLKNETKNDASKKMQKVIFNKSPKKHQFVALKGSDFQAGKVIMKKFDPITPFSIPYIVSSGYEKIQVFSKPELSIIITGDEIILPSNSLNPGQVRDSNTVILKSLINKYNIILKDSCRLIDNEKIINEKIIEYLKKSDIVIINGGVSKGLFDYVHKVIKNISTEVLYYKAAILPGKPSILAKYNDKYLIGVPGNPLTVITNFEMIILPLINKLSGKSETFQRRFVFAKLDDDYKKNNVRLHFVPGILYNKNNDNYFKCLRFNNSADVAAVVKSNAIMEAPKEIELLKKNSVVKVYF